MHRYKVFPRKKFDFLSPVTTPTSIMFSSHKQSYCEKSVSALEVQVLDFLIKISHLQH